VKQVINASSKNHLTPIVHKNKAPEILGAEVVPECLNLTNMTSLGEQDSTQILQGDILSALAFDTTGKFLSIGDYGGRCIIFSEGLDEDKNKTFDYYMEFQAHDKSIDYYSNQQIPDMVSNIVWLTQPTQKSLLTCNAREVKLWSIKEHQQYQVTSSKRNYKSKNKLIIPKSKPNGEAIPESKLRHTFKSGLETNLHSLSLTSDHQ
jgi:hypothetical protein